MSILADEDSDLTQVQKLGKAYGICRQRLGIGKKDLLELGQLILDSKKTESSIDKLIEWVKKNIGAEGNEAVSISFAIINSRKEDGKDEGKEDDWKETWTKIGKTFEKQRKKRKGKLDFSELYDLILDSKIPTHLKISKKGLPFQVKEHERKVTPKSTLNKKDVIEMFNFFHDVVRDIGEGAGESEAWSKSFTEGFEEIMKRFDFLELQKIIADLKIEGYYKTVNNKRVWVESYEADRGTKKEEVLKKVAKLIEETGYERGRAEAEIESQMKEEEEAKPEFKAKKIKAEVKLKAKEEKTQVKIETKEQRLKVALDEFQSLGMVDNLLINVLAPIIKLVIKGMASGKIEAKDVARTILTIKNNKTVKENKKKEILSIIDKLEKDLVGLKSLHDFMVVNDLTKDQVSVGLGGAPLSTEIMILAHEIAMKVPAPTLISPTGVKVEGVIETGDIPLIAIQSSNVKGGGVYGSELIVQFHQTAKQGGQRTYRYKLDTREQAREVFMELVNATSAGRWVWENIRGTKTGPAIMPPHKPTIGGTTASLIPYAVSGRSPIKTRKGYKEYDELSKELRKYKMAVKEPPTAAEAFTRPELHKFQRKEVITSLRKAIPRAQISQELRELWKKINVRIGKK